jgi:plasmid stabilization system protein ParE
MKYIVSLTSRAEQDRERAFEWYSKNYSPAFAHVWFNGIVGALSSLATHPERCHRARENDQFSFDLYELVYGKRRNKYRILFRIHRNIALVLHIRHSAQDDVTEDPE